MNYLKLEKCSVSNGNGFRVVLWVSGCTMNCKDCFNPETWIFCSGKYCDESVYKKIKELLSKPYIEGITFTGGHPLEEENLVDIMDLITNIKKDFGDTKNIWMYTGYTIEDIFSETSDSRRAIVSMCDVLVDGPYIPK